MVGETDLSEKQVRKSSHVPRKTPGISGVNLSEFLLNLGGAKAGMLLNSLNWPPLLEPKSCQLGQVYRSLSPFSRVRPNHGHWFGSFA